jgi:hypothetical protein
MADLLSDATGRDSVLGVPLQSLVEFPGFPVDRGRYQPHPGRPGTNDNPVAATGRERCRRVPTWTYLVR